ncbi:glucose-6-phosphate isomerase [Clostridium swellfunianum]|uniref:glucose-6-phosphate isomerase n=1 Tax=Clostridium swellfunianum TaxID=1367462 RepID=UPI00202FE40F|nr:glucose-6-phosphate isomerase [Clostridium swellfunianum]MCM0649966.1 glucose-6-phosphate isomerase [Clostridium swellfunianum]
MLKFDFENSLAFLGDNNVFNYIEENEETLKQLFSEKKEDKEQFFGWFNVEKWKTQELIVKMKQKSQEICEKADVFVLIGVGGSNNGARSLIKALAKESKVEVLYAGNNLSSNAICELLDKLKGKSVYMNIIAKNFETLEPGLSFRILRRFMWEQYGDDIAERVIVTGTEGSPLHRLADENGYMFLPFPKDIGGRFSVLSPVGLFPSAAAGIDIEEILYGAMEMERELKGISFRANPAVIYAVIRHLLEERGFAMEFLSFFEPDLEYFSKWWVQLFAESEGKNHKGLYPVACSFSEDLHSVGQYIQSGKRNLAELFLHVENVAKNYRVHPDIKITDGFDYLDYMEVKMINDIAFRATVQAHTSGSVPCNIITVSKLTPYYFGQLFYFFQFTCYISGMFNAVNPFDQPGVEAYKSEMFKLLKKYD